MAAALVNDDGDMRARGLKLFEDVECRRPLRDEQRLTQQGAKFDRPLGRGLPLRNPQIANDQHTENAIGLRRRPESGRTSADG